jgi:hypothetical protein
MLSFRSCFKRLFSCVTKNKIIGSEFFLKIPDWLWVPMVIIPCQCDKQHGMGKRAAYLKNYRNPGTAQCCISPVCSFIYRF